MNLPEVKYFAMTTAIAAWRGKRVQRTSSQATAERQSEEAALQAEPPTPSDFELVNMASTTEVPCEWRFRDAVLKVHLQLSNGQIPAVPITFHVFAHRAQLLVRTSGKPLDHQDVWPVMGRMKREKP
eukprot:6466543-Amphidinium_carterae.1